MKIAFFEPWYGGSHRAFLDAWNRRTRHELTVYGLAPRHWKWRQEASAWELARRAHNEPAPDLIACSDYVDLPRLIGFLPAPWRGLPTLAYFHENQLTYGDPDRGAGDSTPDFTHGFCNILTAIRADALVFNSSFHLDDFARAATALLARLPKPVPGEDLRRALDAAQVLPPLPELADVALGPGGRAGSPLRIVFPHRLEPDKAPHVFFDAAARAAEHVDLELVLLGGDLARAVPGIQEAGQRVSSITAHAGYAKDRNEYLRLLGSADLVASTATHEFFGIAFLEAMAAGCQPLAPDRLNYPSLVSAEGLYGPEEDLTARLMEWASPESLALARNPDRRKEVRASALRFGADAHAGRLDRACEAAAGL